MILLHLFGDPVDCLMMFLAPINFIVVNNCISCVIPNVNVHRVLQLDTVTAGAAVDCQSLAAIDRQSRHRSSSSPC